MAIAYLLFLGGLTAQRLWELAISRRNAAWSLARGGVEFGRGHLLPMKLLHTAFLLGCVAEVTWGQRPFIPVLGWPMLGLFTLAQWLRWISIQRLGRAWSIRVIVRPGEPLQTDGIYHWIRHPNYLAVIMEGVAIPLIHTAWITALGFSLLNAWLLWVRIRCEEQALTSFGSNGQQWERTRRFLPVNKEVL